MMQQNDTWAEYVLPKQQELGLHVAVLTKRDHHEFRGHAACYVIRHTLLKGSNLTINARETLRVQHPGFERLYIRGFGCEN